MGPNGQGYDDYTKALKDDMKEEIELVAEIRTYWQVSIIIPVV